MAFHGDGKELLKASVERCPKEATLSTQVLLALQIEEICYTPFSPLYWNCIYHLQTQNNIYFNILKKKKQQIDQMVTLQKGNPKEVVCSTVWLGISFFLKRRGFFHPQFRGQANRGLVHSVFTQKLTSSFPGCQNFKWWWIWSLGKEKSFTHLSAEVPFVSWQNPACGLFHMGKRISLWGAVVVGAVSVFLELPRIWLYVLSPPYFVTVKRR